jgi:hypothetical protein
VVTVTLMVLVSVVALALLSLSAVSLRTSRAGAAQAEARANARLAVLLALGELQRLAGPDTRITAPGVAYGEDSSSDSDSPVLGVWRSWEGLDRDQRRLGRPRKPDYELKAERGSIDDQEYDGRFLGYLVSRPDDDPWDPDSPPDLQSGEVTLVGEHSAGDEPSDQVLVDPVKLNDGAGGMAWWVSGENQKAALGVGREPTGETEWADLAGTGSYADAAAFDLENLDDLPKAASRLSLDLLPTSAAKSGAQPVSQRHFHDLTRWSRGLLTNAAAGGFKRDMSLVTERWDDLPRDGLPFYSVRPGVVAEATQKVAYNGQGSFLYPWAKTLRGEFKGGGAYGSYEGPVVPWRALRDFCTQYRYIASGPGDGHVVMPTFAQQQVGGNGDQAGDLASNFRVRRFPQVARIQFVLSYSAIPDPAGRIDSCGAVRASDWPSGRTHGPGSHPV